MTAVRVPELPAAPPLPPAPDPGDPIALEAYLGAQRDAMAQQRAALERWAADLVKQVDDFIRLADTRYQPRGLPLELPIYTVQQALGAAAPPLRMATSVAGLKIIRLAFLTSGVVTSRIAWSDGTNWRWVDTNAIVT